MMILLSEPCMGNGQMIARSLSARMWKRLRSRRTRNGGIRPLAAVIHTCMNLKLNSETCICDWVDPRVSAWQL